MQTTAALKTASFRPFNAPIAAPAYSMPEIATPRPAYRTNFLRDVIWGLTHTPKGLACKYFYDAKGSELFERICEQPEYYPTRTEMALLQNILDELNQTCSQTLQMVELGSGAGEKTRLLLESMPQIKEYVPIDISREILLSSSAALNHDFPALKVSPCCLDFTAEESWERVPSTNARRLVFFPGSTIGNFHPHEACLFLAKLRKLVGPRGYFLIGVDLQKDTATLEHAYNDAEGVTAAFNLNLLDRIRHELGVDIPENAFFHNALYNEALHRVEMHLVCRRAHRWQIGGETISFTLGETIHTENSYKYTVEGFQQLAQLSGFNALECWTDERNLFSIHLLSVNQQGVTA